ncbi:hypothetical protein BV898_13819, partial [Hypsibius exemplaris]
LKFLRIESKPLLNGATKMMARKVDGELCVYDYEPKLRRSKSLDHGPEQRFRAYSSVNLPSNQTVISPRTADLTASPPQAPKNPGQIVFV